MAIPFSVAASSTASPTNGKTPTAPSISNSIPTNPAFRESTRCVRISRRGPDVYAPHARRRRHGSGKSVCIDAIITSLLLTHTPDTLRLLMMIHPACRADGLQRHPAPDRAVLAACDVERVVPVLQGDQGDGTPLQAVRQGRRAEHRNLRAKLAVVSPSCLSSSSSSTSWPI